MVFHRNVEKYEPKKRQCQFSECQWTQCLLESVGVFSGKDLIGMWKRNFYVLKVCYLHEKKTLNDFPTKSIFSQYVWSTYTGHNTRKCRVKVCTGTKYAGPFQEEILAMARGYHILKWTSLFILEIKGTGHHHNWNVFVLTRCNSLFIRTCMVFSKRFPALEM